MIQNNISPKMKSEILSFLFILLLISCQQHGAKVVEAEFNVNKTLLSDSTFTSRTGFSINPPRNWFKTARYNSELKNKILYRLDSKLLAIYKSDTTNCALIISELPESDFVLIKRLLGTRKPSLAQDSVWTNVQSSFFKYKTFEVIQVVAQNSKLIVFKLYTHRLSELYELDYVVPRSEINFNMQSVESSIGSLN
jgi:hypothetical protein